MTGRNINIYFQEETYNKLRQIIRTREISRFVNTLRKRSCRNCNSKKNKN
ncbi:MAG: hypothetical protein MRECE_22c021 [Mycoplasmataceae bacterium CE_OT135]|nr:MAG: hypothetical protein MRECE_22c021 [Mycoplasmataceae bacterium CE_OT135]